MVGLDGWSDGLGWLLLVWRVCGLVGGGRGVIYGVRGPSRIVMWILSDWLF